MAIRFLEEEEAVSPNISPQIASQDAETEGIGGQPQGIGGQPQGIGGQPQGIVGKVKDAFTGESRTTPEIEELPNIGELPELNKLNFEGLRSALVTMTGDDEEAAQTLQANFPNIQVREDEKGNIIVRSGVDNQEYVVNKPGLDARDLIKTGLVAAMFLPVGGVPGLIPKALVAAATQTGLETAQKAGGGEFNYGQIAGAAVGETILPGGIHAVKGLTSLGKQTVKSVAKAVKPATKAVKPEMDLTGIGNLAKKASRSSGRARKKIIKDLGDNIKISEKTVDSAKRLRIDEYMEPDQLSTSQAFKEVSQAVKSIPGSKARMIEQQNIQKVKEGVDVSLSELGAIDDMSSVNDNVKSTLENSIETLEKKSDNLYNTLTAKIGPKTKVDPSKLLEAIEQRGDDVGGIHNLPSIEKNIYNKIKPKLDDKKNAILPTYGLIDQERKAIGEGLRNRGPFKDQSTGVLKYLYSGLTELQESIADKVGQKETLELAKKTVKARKSIEESMTSLFGKHLDQHLTSKLTKGVVNLGKQDTRSFINFIKHIPKDMRQEVTASGLGAALGKMSKKGDISFKNYSQWFDNLKRNKQAFSALMVNLPPRARRRLQDFYNVSKAISDTSEGYIATGRLQAAKEVMNGSDGIISNIYNSVKSATRTAIPAEIVTSTMGFPGSGTVGALISSFKQGKTDIMKKADDLISSPVFINSIKKIGTPLEEEGMKKLSRSKYFVDFYKKTFGKYNSKEAQRWLTASLQAKRQLKEGEKE